MSSADSNITMQLPRESPPPRNRPGWPAVAVATLAVLAVGAIAWVVLAGGDDQGVKSENLGVTATTVRPSPTTSAAPDSQPNGGSTVTTARPPVPTTTPQTDRLTSATRLSLDGIGPVDIGMTLEQASAAAGLAIRYGDEYAPDNSCRYARAADGPEGLGFMVIDGRIARVDVSPVGSSMRPSPIKTVSGIGIGSTEDEVKRTYPGRIRVEPAKYDPNGHDLVYTPNDASLRHLSMIFVTDGHRVSSFRAGLAGPVGYVEGCS